METNLTYMIIKAFILFLTIWFSYLVVTRFINNIVLILRQGKPRKDADAAWLFELFAAIFWTIYIIF